MYCLVHAGRSIVWLFYVRGCHGHMDDFWLETIDARRLKCLPLPFWIYLYPGVGGGSTSKPFHQETKSSAASPSTPDSSSNQSLPNVHALAPRY